MRSKQIIGILKEAEAGTLVADTARQKRPGKREMAGAFAAAYGTEDEDDLSLARAAFWTVVRLAARPCWPKVIFSVSLFAVIAHPMLRATAWAVVRRLRRRVKGLPS